MIEPDRPQILINALIVEVESGAKPGRALVRFPGTNGREWKQRQKSVSEIGKIRRMQRKAKATVANKFNKLDFHDDALISIKIYPPRSLSNFARIDFELQDDSSGALKCCPFGVARMFGS